MIASNFDDRLNISRNKKLSGEKLDRNLSAVNNMGNIMKEKMMTLVLRSGAKYSMQKNTVAIINKDQIECKEAQKRIIRDQNEGYKKFPTTNRRLKSSGDKQAVKKVEDLIASVTSGGPSGLPQLGALSDAVNRPIEVYNEKTSLKYIIGDDKKGNPVKLEHHKPRGDQKTGHFTLPGGKEPGNKSSGKNMCLYDVVGAQTGRDPAELKSATLKIMENNKSQLSDQVADIASLELHKSTKLCMGGARYNGETPRDAGRHLDDSNGVRGFGKDRTAHPRMHASVPDANDQTDCVEKYSIGGWKSGHDSRDEQDFVTHHALMTDKAKTAMDRLNEYDGNRNEDCIRQVIHVTKGELNLPRDSGAGRWEDGKRTQSWPAKDVTLVLQHHVGRERDKHAPVHIQTAYPDQPY